MILVPGEEARKAARDAYRGCLVLLKRLPEAMERLEGLSVVRAEVMVDQPPGGVQDNGLDETGADVDAYPHGVLPRSSVFQRNYTCNGSVRRQSRM